MNPTALSARRLCLPVAALALGLLPARGAAALDWLPEWSYDFAANQHQNLAGSDGWVGGALALALLALGFVARRQR